MSVWRTREGPFATVNTWANLITLGSQGTVNAITVPEGKQSIKELKITFCEPAPADSAGGLICVKLSGGGLVYGDQFFLAGGLGREQTGNSAYADAMAPVKLLVDVAVQPGEIWVSGGQYGTDMGTPEAAVGVCFSNASAPERYYRIRMAACGTLDTDAALSAMMNESPGAFVFAGHMKKIYSITTAQGAVYLATATGGTAHVTLKNGIKQGDQVVTAGGTGTLSTGTGVSGGYSFAVQRQCELDLNGEPINAYGCQTGVDWGTPYIGVGLEVGP